MPQREPIRVFVTHCFDESDDYLRVFEYLESARNFFYRNCSAPKQRPASGSQDGLREQLRQQITPAEVVIALSSLYPAQQDLLLFELNYAKASDKPVPLLPNFGDVSRSVPSSHSRAWWTEQGRRGTSAALDRCRCRRQARHEDTIGCAGTPSNSSWIKRRRRCAVFSC